MQTINAIFDGNIFKPLEPIPVKGKYEVVITFTNPVPEDSIEMKRQRILECFGTWDDDDVKLMQEMIDERCNFSRNRLVNWLT